ncbi:hypothetical protein ACHHYP_05503 [Achlya hypogyna]|uniref:RING-type domain-containing protein n=1 Tax=Achlya hypogyna TaxID=1202772 RepID=A0A1V9YXL7_ACHHY|nr:hypothetical protein ACHHYP_05503 [Achlya hypogyna]
MSAAKATGAALWEAAHLGRINEVQQLLVRISNDISLKSALEFRHPMEATTPLLAAVLARKTEAVSLLAQAGSRVHATTRTKKKSTPLHVAAYYDFDDVMRVLIFHGADVYRWNAQGQLPLDVARFKGHASCIAVLLRSMEVYQAPLSFRHNGDVFKGWKRSYARLIRVSSEKKAPQYELAFYPTKDSACPTKVAWFSPDTTSLVAADGIELRFAPPAVWVSFRPATFTRDLLPAHLKPYDFRLQAESDAAVREWVNVCAVVGTQSRGRRRTELSDVFVPSSPSPYADGIARFLATSPVGDRGPRVFATISRSAPEGSRSPSPACPSKTVPDFAALAIAPIEARVLPPSAPEVTAAPSAPSLEEALTVEVRPVPAYPIAAFATVVRPKERDTECVVCFDQPKNSVCLPCRHLSCCNTCLAAIELCPLCRAPIESILQIYT